VWLRFDPTSTPAVDRSWREQLVATSQRIDAWQPERDRVLRSLLACDGHPADNLFQRDPRAAQAWLSLKFDPREPDLPARARCKIFVYYRG